MWARHSYLVSINSPVSAMLECGDAVAASMTNLRSHLQTEVKQNHHDCILKRMILLLKQNLAIEDWTSV